MKFEDAKKYKFVLEPRYYYFGWTKQADIVGRPSFLKALAHARTFLPKGYNFKIWDLQRPLAVQIAMIKSFERRFKSQHPLWSTKKMTNMIYKYAAKPLPDKAVTRLDCHRNGGAVDITIVDKQGNELFMGTDHDDLTVKASSDYYELINFPTAIEREARNNRRLLRKVLEKNGFENIKSEWWHWSHTL